MAWLYAHPPARTRSSSSDGPCPALPPLTDHCKVKPQVPRFAGYPSHMTDTRMSDATTHGDTDVSTPSAAATTVPAAARTMALFEAFAREKRELTKSELAR